MQIKHLIIGALMGASAIGSTWVRLDRRDVVPAVQRHHSKKGTAVKQASAKHVPWLAFHKASQAD